MIDPVVELEWVRAQVGPVVLADVRWYLDGRSGLAAYRAGHLPGAVFVDLDRWLAGPASPAEGRHPLPDPEIFAKGMAAAGIGEEDTVIAYDDAGGVIAARLVWMLRATGHDAALLDGGLTAYTGELETAEGPGSGRTGKVFTTRAWPAARLAALDDAAGGSFVVLDARDRARFPRRHRTGRSAGGAHPGRPEPALPGQRGRDRAVPAGRGATGSLRGRRRHRRYGSRLLLWIGRHGVSQLDRARTRRPRSRSPLSGIVVAVQRR